jgi:hypothetical protein
MKKSIQSALVMFVFLTVLLSGCAPASTPVPPTFTPVPTATATPIVYNAAINVVDENGKPIPEAKIVQGETVEFTDNQGVWQKSSQSPELSIGIWAQGYLLQKHSSTLQAGDNKIQIQLLPDPLGLKTADLEKEGYKLVFVEDFQDGIPDCIIKGNGNVAKDDTNSGNQLLLVDLRNLEDSFSCFFGPTNIQDAIIEIDFRYPEIRYSDFKENDYYHWQGYYIEFRDNFNVQGYPLQVPGGATLQVMDFTTSEWKFPLQIKQNIQEKRWYQFSTKYDGTKVEARMDGSLRFTFLKPPTMSNSKQSHFGAFGQAYIQFDNIKMWIPNK